MPTKVNVRVNSITHTTQLSKAGDDLNYVVITGFDETNNKGFKKQFFATTKAGEATKPAEMADTLNKDDWVEITMDDTSYKNVMTIKKIPSPAGAQAPNRSNTGASGGGGGGGMTKAEWAAKDARKEAAISRNSALKAAVEFMKIVGKVKGKDNVDLTLDVARRFEDFLTAEAREPGDDRDIDVNTETLPNGNIVNLPVEEDEEIPF